jgi:hypothetical protein
VGERWFFSKTSRGAADSRNGRERLEAQKHAPYRTGLSRRARGQSAEPNDSQLAEEAIELARLEQQRTPADLVNLAA